MTDQEFASVAALLKHGFRGEWNDEKAGVYRVLLERYTAEQVTAAVLAIVHSGKPFLPEPGEIIAALNDDPSVPTAAEWTSSDHPLAEAFRRCHGDWTLAPLHDPDHGHLERARWEQRFSEFIDAHRHRSVHELARLGTRADGDMRSIVEALRPAELEPGSGS